MNWGERARFQTELGKMFEKASYHLSEDVEVAWKEFKGTILAVTESVVNGGACTEASDTPQGYTCTCTPGWEGGNCQTDRNEKFQW